MRSAQRDYSNQDVFFVSLGCPKNLVDSEVMLGVLAKARYRVVPEPDSAGVIVVNTCGFIDASKKESIDTVLEMAAFKDRGSCHTLVMTGCLVQRYPEELKSGLDEVDLFIGTSEYHKIAEHLTSLRISPERAFHLTEPTYIHQSTTPRLLTGPPFSAFLKVSEGCNKKCSFCIIPMMRGKLRSRSVDSLVEEADRLVTMGVKELCLVAQDLTDYGLDLGERRALVSLLEKLAKIPKLEWMRLFYSYPDGITDELIALMRSEPKLCNYLDMPLQHASDPVLRRMNRAITHRKMTTMVEKLRKQIPDVSIRTSLIVGFPGETDEDFKTLCQFVEWARLDHVGLFKYSKEEGTSSANLDGHLADEIKQERYEILSTILGEIALKNAAVQKGRRYRVLLEGPHPETPDLLTGRNERQARDIDTTILINDGLDTAASAPQAGEFVTVEITDHAGPDLIGRIV